MTQIQSST